MAGLTRTAAARRWLVPAHRLRVSRLRRPADLHGGHLTVAALAGLCLLLGVRLALAAFAPPPPAPADVEPSDADPAELSRLDPFFGAAAADAMPVTALPLKLRGVRVDGASGRGGAFIEGADGLQAAYGVGDGIGGATLVAVAEDHVVLDNGGRRETLWIDGGGAASAEPGDAAGAPQAAPAVATARVTLPAGRGTVLTGEAARAAAAADPEPAAVLGDASQ